MTAEEKRAYDIANSLYKRHELPHRIQKSRGLMSFNNLGRFYVLDISTNIVIDSHIDILEWSINMIINDYCKRAGITLQGSKDGMAIYGPSYTEEGQKIDCSGLFD